MAKHTFDLDVLRSFVTGMELGSFARAADRLGRSTSAVSAQIRKLEDQAGTTIFRKVGRGLALTEAGETMLSYARRLLDLNDEAAIAVQGMAAEGIIRIGMQEDFGEVLLPKVLGRFARANPKIRIEARVGRKGDLMARIATGRLDLAIAWDEGAASAAMHKSDLATVPVGWIGPNEAATSIDAQAGPLPLISYDDSCWFRTTGTAELDRVGRPWRVTLTSPNLSGIWAGVSAGLGLTIRTPLGLGSGVRFLAAGDYGLPPLPPIRLALYRAETEHDPAAERLADILVEETRLVL